MKDKFRITAAGPKESGKTITLDLLARVLAANGVHTTHDRDNHTLVVELDDAERRQLATLKP